MRKYILLASLFVLASCTLPWSSSSGPHTLESDYARVVSQSFDGFDKDYKKIFTAFDTLYTRLSPSGYDDSRLRFFFDIPDMQSRGDINIVANAVRESWKNMSAKISLTGSAITPQGALDIRDVRGEFTSVFPDKTFFKFDALNMTGSLIEGMSREISEVSKHLGKWFVYKTSEVYNMGTESSPEMIGAQIGSAVMSDILQNGFQGIRDIIAKYPIITPTASGALSGDMYSYPVALNNQSVVALADTFVHRYTGTGLSEQDKNNMTQELNNIEFSGVFSVHKDDASVYSLSGVLTNSGQTDSLALNVSSTKDSYTIQTNKKGSIFVSKWVRNKDNITYTVNLQEQDKPSIETLRYDGVHKDNHYEGTLTFGDTSMPNELIKIQSKYIQDNFAFSVEKSSPDMKPSSIKMLDVSGAFEGMRLAKLEAKISEIPGLTVSSGTISFQSQKDGNFAGKLTLANGPAEPIEVNIDGYAHDNDYKLKAESSGMSIVFLHKKNADGHWEGNLILPMGNTMTWNGLTQKDVLKSLNFSLKSMFVQASMNLVEEGDGVRGPFEIQPSNGTSLTGTVTLKTAPKVFNFRIDTTLPDMKQPSYFGMESFVDIRWDKSAKVSVPEHAESAGILLKSFETPHNERPMLIPSNFGDIE